MKTQTAGATKKLALRQIDWFLTRGYLLGERKSKGQYYIVRGTEERVFSSIWEAQQYVETQS